VIDIPGAPQPVVAVVVGDHDQLTTRRHLDLVLESAKVRRTALQVVQQAQYIQVRTQVIPQGHKGFLECDQGCSGPLKLLVNCHPTLPLDKHRDLG
jgi:hypothetical protein